MIKKAFLLCLCLLTLPVFAQTGSSFQKELSVGGSAGIGLSSVSFTPKVQQKMFMGYTAGFTARWITNPNAGLQLEINYSQQGWDEDNSEKPDYYYTRKINYIQVPFLSHFYVGKRAVRVVFVVGPQIGYAFSESTDTNLEENELGIEIGPTKSTKQRNMPIENKFSWGLTGGMGLELRTGIGHFILEGRYFFSLGEIYPSGKADVFARSAPQLINVKLSYLIPISKK